MADLRSIAQSGVDPSSGEYFSAEQRKKIFNKGRMKTPISATSFVSRNESIVKYLNKQEESQEESVEQDQKTKSELDGIKAVSYKVLQVKKERKRLSSKFYKLRSQTDKRIESKEDPGGEKQTLGSGMVRRKAVGLFGGIFGMLGDLLAFGVLSWIGDPKNRKTVETFVKLLAHLFKFLNMYVGAMIDNLLGGFASLVGGDSLLEKIGGFFKLLGGILMLRWLKNPLKLIKDIKFVIKNFGNIRKIFSSLFRFDFKGALGGFNKILANMGGIFRRGVGRIVNRLLLKVFGRGLQKIAKRLLKIAAKTVGKVVRKIPAIGPLIGIAIDLAFGVPIDEAVVRAGGALLGSALGATLAGVLGGILGSVVPVIGNFLLGSAGALAGGVVGSFIGEWIAISIYKGVKGLFGGGDKKDDKPELSEGGVVSGPKQGFLAVLHGTEVVIPIAKIGEILFSPFKELGKAIVGSLFALLDSIGPVGNFVKPFAKAILAPQIKLFGMEEYAYNTDVGETKGSAETAARKVENKEKEKEEKNKTPDQRKGPFDILKGFASGVGAIFKSVTDTLMGGGAKAATRDPSVPGAEDSFGPTPSGPGTGDSGGGASPSVGGARGNFGPHTLALLDAIAFAEGTFHQPNTGYNTHFAFDQTQDLSQHPAIIKSGGKYRSDAFGRYQFMSPTWRGLGGAVAAHDGKPAKSGMDMSPANQDFGAVQLILSDLKHAGIRVNGASDLEKVLKEEGVSKRIAAALSGTWASFPNAVGQSAYGQPVKKLAKIQNFYSGRVRTQSSKSQQNPNTPAQQNNNTAGQLQQEPKSTPHKPNEPTNTSQTSSSGSKPTITSQMQSSNSQDAKTSMVQMSTESNYQRRIRNRRGRGTNLVISSTSINNSTNVTNTQQLNTNTLSDRAVLNRL